MNGVELETVVDFRIIIIFCLKNGGLTKRGIEEKERKNRMKAGRVKGKC